MKILKSIFLLILPLSLIISCSSDDSDSNNPPPGLDPTQYYEALNVSYGNDSDQVFDIYLPANRSLDTKIMILVHGGGWYAGDKADMNSFKDFVREQHPDIGVVNINYRLADADNSPYPMQLNDITSVINFLKDERDNYVIDNEFGFVGVSAGAHLSLLWSYAFDTENNVEMVCSIVGPTNLTDTAYLNNTSPELQEILDLYGVDASTEFLEEASPYHRVTASSPPTILFYGGMDPLVPTTQGTDLRDRLSTLGVTHEFTLYPNEGHGWIGLNLLDTSTKLKTFTETYLED